MKKIFTLILAALATTMVMAQVKYESFDTKLPLTWTLVDGSKVTIDEQVVTLTPNLNEEGKPTDCSLTFKDLQTPMGKMGDVTFSPVEVKYSYGVYYLSSTDETVGNTADGRTLVMQMESGELSPMGYGNPSLEFYLFDTADDDFFLMGTFKEKSEEFEYIADGAAYYIGQTAEGGKFAGQAAFGLYADNEGLLILSVDGLAMDAKETAFFPTFVIAGLEMQPSEDGTSYAVSANETIGTFVDNPDDGVFVSLDLTISPNYGIGGMDEDDDFGFGDDDFGGVDPGAAIWPIEGKMEVTSLVDFANYTYTFTQNEDVVVSIKQLDTVSIPTSDIYSLSGMKMNKMQKGINIINRNGKMVKVIK